MGGSLVVVVVSDVTLVPLSKAIFDDESTVCDAPKPVPFPRVALTAGTSNGR